jgi:hypothetical protein
MELKYEVTIQTGSGATKPVVATEVESAIERAVYDRVGGLLDPEGDDFEVSVEEV